MWADCGANKEDVIAPGFAAFFGCLQKETGGVAGVPQPPVGTVFASLYFFSAGIPDGSLKKRKKSLSGLSSMVEPPEPNACL